VLERKVVEDGCTLHFLDTSKMNINKVLRHKCTKDLAAWVVTKIMKGLGFMKTYEQHSHSEYVQCRDHTAFFIKAYTDSFRSNVDVVFDEEHSINLLCTAAESTEIII
jgi:hypothetical protein